MSLCSGERETTINACDDDEMIRIWSAQRTYITKMRNHPAFTQIDTGFHESTEWARFTIPADQWSPTGAKRRLNLSSEQRQAAGARLAAARA